MKRQITLAIVFLMALSAGAKVWTVTDPSAVGSRTIEPTPYSLQYYVNNADDGDTISFDPLFSGQTILFDTTLVINTGLVIDASGLAQPVHFDGQKKTTLITLGNSSEKNESLQDNTFRNIVFENGMSDVAGQGGAVNIFAYRIRFEKCMFLNNENMTDNTNRQPGAIRNETSSSQMWLTDCVFRGNKTKRKGGAIAIDAPSLYINRCLFDDNHAGESGAVLAIKSTKDNVVLRDNTPIVDIRNSTFVGNKCDQNQTSASGLIIISDDSKGIVPIRLFFNTFVGNVNEINTGTVYSIYAANNNITMAGNVFGGNKHITEDPGVYALCGDANAGGGKMVISNGYNFIYRLKHNPETDPVNSNDIVYRHWLEVPIMTEQPNADGVCCPTQQAIDSSLWQQLKAMPMDQAEELLGYNPVDQTGAARTSKLVFSGAYEFPAFVLDIDDDYYSVTEPGLGSFVYRSGDIATLATNNENFVSWLVNDKHHVNNPYRFYVTEDCTITVNYDEIPGGRPDPDPEIIVDDALDNISYTSLHYAEGKLYNSATTDGKITIYTLSGSVILNRNIRAKESIAFDKQGIYVAVMHTNDGEISVLKF